LGLEVLVPLWRYAASKSEATRSRWQWTWVSDDSVCKKYGDQLGLVGTWWSGQEHRVLSGIDGVLLVVVIGDGNAVGPVDFAIRRPDPQGPGGPCRDKLHWVQGLLDGRVAAFRRRGVALPPPMVSRIVGLVIRSSCATWPQCTRARSSWKGRVPTSSHCPMGGRSRAKTCSSTAIGLGGLASRCLGCAMHGCGPPVRRMAP